MNLPTPDNEGTLQQLIRLAENHDANAQYHLGMLYANGQGVELDHGKAYAWLQQASDQGVAEASSAIAWLYSMGHGVEQDESMAGKWFIRAAEQGSVRDQYTVAGMYRWGRFGAVTDVDKALYWYHKAAAQGLSHAQHSLGRIYSSGKMVKQDKKQAYLWFSLAILSGHEKAKQSLKELSDSMSQDEITESQEKMHSLIQQADTK